MHVLLAEKWLDLSLTCMSARFDNVMFASLQPSDFLQSVCLHCREMSMIHMRPLKAAGLSFNFGNVIQVVMSVSRCMLQHNVWPLVVWFNILVTSMLPTWYIRWPQNHRFDREVFMLACKILQGNTISSLYWIIYSMVYKYRFLNGTLIKLIWKCCW